MATIPVEFASMSDLHTRVINSNGCDRAAGAELRRRQLTELRASTGATTAADRLDQLQSRRNGPESAPERVVGLWANHQGGTPRERILQLRARRIAAGW
jgi:hypothetical protein